MTSEPETPETSSGDRGVFGNLPSERPGVRSPRRTGEKRASAQKSPPAKASGARSSARSRRSRSRSEAPKAPPRERIAAGLSEQTPSAGPSPEPESGSKGIEDVAWAGVTVAAEAATLGVRLFSRALEAVRERR